MLYFLELVETDEHSGGDWPVGEHIGKIDEKGRIM
jgi:hypothetical protein